MTVAGLVLAAGEGRRFGAPKALVELDGERLVDRAVRVICEGGCEPVVVVAGAAALDVPDAAFVVDNPGWATGMGSSLRMGFAALPERVDAVVVVPVDTPWIGPEAVRLLIAVHGRGAELAVATYAGARRHPVLIGRQHWAGVAGTAIGDMGARGYLANHPDVVEVDCTGTGDPRDVDEPADLGRS